MKQISIMCTICECPERVKLWATDGTPLIAKCGGCVHARSWFITSTL